MTRRAGVDAVIWTPVKKGLDLDRYTLRTVPALVAKLTDWKIIAMVSGRWSQPSTEWASGPRQRRPGG